MRYKKFIIENFKGIDKVELDLTDNRILTLVGLNESGKTTIMKAVELFYQMIIDQQPSESDLKSYRPKGTGFSGNITIKGELLLEKEDFQKINEFWKNTLAKRSNLIVNDSIFSYVFEFEFKSDQFIKTNQRVGLNIKTEKAKKYLYNQNKNNWQEVVNFIKNNLVPEILFYDDFIFEIPNTIQFVKKNAPEGTSISKNIGSNSYWQLVLDDILKSTNSEFESFQNRIVDNWDNDQAIAKQHITEMEGKLNDIITKRWKDLFKNTGKKLNFDKIQINYSSEGHFFNVAFEVITTTHKYFRIDERSKGCQWFFSFLLFTEFRKNRTKNILFLLDEPASNLHSSAQLKILDAIDELSKGSLVIFSTHSHHLIKIDWLKGAYIIINEIIEDQSLEGGMTFYERAKITADKYFNYVGQGRGNDKFSYFQPILDALDYHPSNVEAVPNICILEGKNDWYTFKYFKDIIQKDNRKIYYYPGNGVGKLWDIIRLYLAWGKDFIVVLDGDKEGEKAKKQYIEEFGDCIKQRVFTLNDILGLKVMTEKLVENDDQKLIVESVFGSDSYNKKKKAFNEAICQLHYKKKKVAISKTTTDRFHEINKYIINYFKK